METPGIKAGIVGYGLSGKIFHAPFLHTMGGFELKWIVERHGNSSLLNYPGINIARDYKELLYDTGLDLVVICTPNTLHYPMVRASLEAGKHVVVEKPFVPTSHEADELIQLANKVNRKIFVYHNRRWDGDFLTVKKILDQKLLGDLIEYEAHFDRFRPVLQKNAWKDEDKPGGGILYDLGSHLIDQALVLFGLPRAVFADIKAQRPGSKVDDYFSIHLYYPSHTVLLKAGMMVMEQGPRFILHGNQGSFIKYGLDPQEEKLKQGHISFDENWGREDPEDWGLLCNEKDGTYFRGQVETEPGAYQKFYENVYDVLVNGKDMCVYPEQARDVISIIELAFESSASGQVRKINAN